jgi:archaemetzincin
MNTRAFISTKRNFPLLGNLFVTHCAFFIIVFVVLLIFCESWDLTWYHETRTAEEEMIILVPLGEIEAEFLEVLINRLKETFHCHVKIGEGYNLPPGTYNPDRQQYLSSQILSEIRKAISPAKEEKVLAVTDVDLYVPHLNFVFGEAEFEGHYAIISLTRLRQSYYGLPEDKILFLERMVKEAIHELGHTYGLRHCPHPECVMHFSNSLQDTDKKETSFCRHCQKLLEKKTIIR